MSGFVIKLNILSALCSTIWNNIYDCDETYNYLEPLGFISSLSNNTGFQTWEYSPEFGLRSYLYLWLVGWPAFLFKNLKLPGWSQFLAVRLILSLFSAYSSSSLIKSASHYLFRTSIYKRHTFEFIFTILHCFSPGTFISASSVLPSAAAASVTSMVLSTWINGKLFYSVGGVAFSAIILWPFSACLGIPLALVFVLSRKLGRLLFYSICWAITFLVSSAIVDSVYYGRFACPAWNIIMYNALSALHGSSLSQLYGTESATYYLKNYVLNYNVAFASLFLFGPFIFAHFLFQRVNGSKKSDGDETIKLLVISAAPFFIWNTVFFLQSHKEERFLFPCFPCLELLVALVLTIAFIGGHEKRTIIAFTSSFLLIVFLLSFGFVSLLRILALTQGYSAPMFLIQHLPSSVKSPRTLCIGRDWHHFPSHFLLPQVDENAWRVQFLRSDFSGQLPGKFKEGVGILPATQVPGGHFNNMNMPEKGTYYDVRKCDYVFDRLSPPGVREVQYSDDTQTWRVLLLRKILDRNDDIPIATTALEQAFIHFRRAFYLPGFFKSLNTWADMQILERIHAGY